MTVTVVITTWVVPYDQVVKSITSFDRDEDALNHINQAAADWWKEIDGDRSVAEGFDADNDFPYEPVSELGYNYAHYHAWGGEQGFHAMLDHASYARLHHAHYQREFTDKGMELPGYLQVSYISGHEPK